MKLRRSFLCLVAAPVLWVGCTDVPGPDPEPTRKVSAVFDADTATIPLPNTAALEEDGTLPALAGAGEETANGAFLSWLDGLHGWSEATPITIPFSGLLDESTLTADNFKMYELTADGATEIEIVGVGQQENSADAPICNPTVCGAVVGVVPSITPQPGSTYAVLATNGIKGADGEDVLPSSAVFFAASRSPIVTEEGDITISVLADDPATANSLEGLRQLLAPVFTVAEAEGIERDEIISAQSWSVATDPFTVLDPDTATIPIPNTLAIEADGTFPSAAMNFCGGPGVDPAALADTSCDAPPVEWFSCEATADCDQYRESGDPASQCVGGRCVFTRCAQGQFDAYLDGLHGWPTTTPITLPVAGDINPETLNDESVQVWAVTADGPAKLEGTTVSLSECGDEIVVTLPEDAPAMDYNTNYIAFATKDVEGANGLPLLPPAAVVLALMPYEPGEFVGDCTAEELEQPCDGGGVCAGIPSADGSFSFQCVESLVPNASDADAAAVMQIRPLFQPAVDAIGAAAMVPWDQLAAVWSWQTWTDTFVVFDPLAGNIPFPHTVLTTGCPDEEPNCLIPDGEGATGAIITELKQRDGFSSTAPHWIPTLGPPLVAESVKTSPTNEAGVLFAEADVIPPPLFPADEWTVTYEFDHIVGRFNRPLKPDILVAGLTTTNLMGSNGFEAQPTPAFVFLRSEFPLVDADGVRTIKEIPNDETAAALEQSRSEFEQLFLVALLFGYARDQVNNAWAFTTGDTYRPLQEMRARTLFEMAAGAPVATATTPNVVTNPGTVADPDDATVMVDLSNVQEIHWDLEFDTYWWLDAMNRKTDTPTRQGVGVSIFIPAPAGGCQPPYNVAIAQHGHTNYRRNMALAVANEMAANCIATVAMDMPDHGGRSVSAAGNLHPATRPADSGANYVSEDFIATLNLVQQTVVDQVVLVRMIKEGAFDTALGGAFSDATSQIGYVGNSFGAINGSLLTTIEGDVGPTILNVVGGNYGTILKDSESYGPLLAGTGITPDTFDELQALHFIQWLGEQADPYAFAPYPVLDPVTDLTYDGTSFADGATLPAKDVIIQMVTGDTVVPNSATEPMAAVMGVDLTNTTFPAGTAHGFLSRLDPADPDAAAKTCAVAQAAEWMSTSFAGTATLTTTVTSCGL